MSSFTIFQTSAATSAQIRVGLELVQLAAADASGNVALSPLGIVAALALLISGADGKTRTALGEVLFGPGANLERAETSFAGWLQQLSRVEEGTLAEAGAHLTLASSLWAAEPFNLAPEFVRHAHTQYDAKAASLDFTSPAAASEVNDWVHQHTQGLIGSVVSPATLANLVPPAMLLLNAVYFRARWASEFDVNDTRTGIFRLADGTGQPGEFMHQVSTTIGYTAGDGWQAVSLPYLSFMRPYSMLVFQPDQPSGLPAFLAGLTFANWQAGYSAFQQTPPIEVDLIFPRFRVEWNADLTANLCKMGLAEVFMPGADFTNLGYQSETGGGIISSVMHKTFLEVDEQGTEAAAVTLVMAMGGSAYAPEPLPRVVVKVDSPFFYAIIDQQEGMLLFAGTVNKLD
ncbi:serpin family protein [Hymenobacter agri]